MSGEFSQAVVILLFAGAAIVAITMHEAAHGFVAARLGDPTPAEHGRLSINPLRHLDLVGTLIVPAAILFLPTPSRFIFGWAKPVPIDPLEMGRPRRDMLLVAAVGPLILFRCCRWMADRSSSTCCRRISPGVTSGWNPMDLPSFWASFSCCRWCPAGWAARSTRSMR